MKPSRVASMVLAFVAALLVGSCGREANPSTPARVEDPHVVALARRAIDDVVKARYEHLRGSFDQQMVKALPAPRLAVAWSAFRSLMGSFRSQGEAVVYKRGAFRVVNIVLHMAKGDAQARVTYGPEFLIAGLYLLPPDLTIPR